jgi:epoxide hydrolase-like predicted phosphatase
MPIKAVIFDLGGVLLRTMDFTPRERLAEKLAMDRHELEELVFGGDSGARAQRGEIGVEQHWERVRYQLGYSPDSLKAMLDEFFYTDELDEELVDYVRGLHKSYKTALLSNSTNDLRQRIAEKWHFEDAFDVMIISAEVHVAKPDLRIFRIALDELGVAAPESIFVDDFQRNVEAAQAAGMQAIRFISSQQVQKDLQRLLGES